MATARFNAFTFKALSNTYVLSCSSSMILSTRQFAKAPTEKTEKKPTKNEIKIQKLLKQYRDPLAPKRPPNSYLLWGAEYRKKHDGWSPQTISTYMKQMGATWAALDDKKKTIYTQQSAQIREEYRKQKEIYEKNDGPQKWKDKVSKLSKEKPPSGGYQLWIKTKTPEFKKQNPMDRQSEVLSTTAKAWSDLEAKEKQKWSDKAKAAFEKWEKQLK